MRHPTTLCHRHDYDGAAYCRRCGHDGGSTEPETPRVLCCGPCGRERIDGVWTAARPFAPHEHASHGLCGECAVALYGELAVGLDDDEEEVA
jgi:hypothetical protein